jgi:virginiamycin B lyase
MRWRMGTALWFTAAVLGCFFLDPVAGGAGTDPTWPMEVEVFDGAAGPLASGPENALWFAAGTKLGKVDGDGTVTELPLSESVGSLQAIVAGREGALWATRGHEVDRITPSGEVTRFPLPRNNEKAGQITVAQDGTLWFTVWAREASKESLFGTAFVVRMQPDGRMTRFPLRGPARRRHEPPASIVSGPGGAIWFTDPAFSRVGRLTRDGKLTEFRVRLQPEVLAPDGADGLWFVGFGGVGKINASGEVRELRTGDFYGLAIGSAFGAAAGPEGDLWFIGGATRVMRLTHSGHLTVVRGPGAPAAIHIALGPGGAIWLSTAPDPVKGVLGAPLLRYEPGLPGVEVQPGFAAVRDGRFRIRLSCGGSAGACIGDAKIVLGRKQIISSAYRLAAESDGPVTLTLPARERHGLAQSGYSRVAVYASADGGYGGFSELVLRSPHPPAPRPGRPLVMPLPEDVELDGFIRGPGDAFWTGDGIGRFNRILPGGRVSTVDVPGLEVEPAPLGFGPHRELWFFEYSGYQVEPVLGRLAPGGKLSRVRLPAGARLEDASLGAKGEIWVVRSDYPDPGEIDRVSARGEISRFPVGVEPGTIVAGRDGSAWFAESGPRIVHIGASGEMRIFHLPHKGFVDGMALGRRGEVWFTRWARRYLPPAIGHITPGGRIVERPVRHVGEPRSILVAPDGNVWFTTEFTRRIVRMSPGGKLKAWRRGAAAAGAIAPGPEGNIWFAAADQDTIAAFHP